MWQSHVLSHTFPMAFFFTQPHGGSFCPHLAGISIFLLAVSSRIGPPHLSPVCLYTLTQTQLKKHKPQDENITKFDCTRIKNFCSMTDTVHKAVRQMEKWEKILTLSKIIMRLICRLWISGNQKKKAVTLIEKWTKALNKQFKEEEAWMLTSV